MTGAQKARILWVVRLNLLSFLDPANLNHTREKSPGGKVEYHNIGASFDVLRAMGELEGE